MITVEKLIKILENLENQKAVVILSRDSEGNNFRPLAKDVSPQYEFTNRGDLVGGGRGRSSVSRALARVSDDSNSDERTREMSQSDALRQALIEVRRLLNSKARSSDDYYQLVFEAEQICSSALAADEKHSMQSIAQPAIVDEKNFVGLATEGKAEEIVAAVKKRLEYGLEAYRQRALSVAATTKAVQSIARKIIPRVVVDGEHCPLCPISAATSLVRLEGESEDLRKCMECGGVFSKAVRFAYCLKCPSSFSTRLVEMERGGDTLQCRACRRMYQPCGNCDVPGLIPEGKTAADCSVCEGKGIVQLGPFRKEDL